MGEDQQKRHRSLPIKESISKIGGYPDKLVIYKLEASSFWWCRYYTQRKILRKSTKTSDKREAINFAKKFYEEILLREHNLMPLTASASFEKCAEALITEQGELMLRGERNPKINIQDRQKLKKDILPFFKNISIKEITYKHINQFVMRLVERKLKPSSIKNHLNLIHKILNLAQREGLVDRLPSMPKVKLKDSPRGWFNLDQYEHLRNTVFKLIDEKVVVRYHLLDDEMRLFITFMVNTFLRPSDIKNLKHRNIEIVEKEDVFLRIQTDSSKTINSPIVSMPAGVGIYKDIVNYQKKMDRSCAKDDFVFFPHLKKRDYALQTMRRQFDEILSKAELKRSSSGESRTLYSLRHTAIMFRLTKGDNIDLLTLARNARTSVDMIERFYARPLQAEMNVGKLQSMRKTTT